LTRLLHASRDLKKDSFGPIEYDDVIRALMALAHSFHFANMKKEIEKAFDFASDLAKQLITLTTAIIAAIITFFQNSSGTQSTEVSVRSFQIPLIVFLISILSGLCALMALTQQLTTVSDGGTPHSTAVRLPSAIQILLFLVGVGWTIAVVLHMA
jgi:hypothetical protein